MPKALQGVALLLLLMALPAIAVLSLRSSPASKSPSNEHGSAPPLTAAEFAAPGSVDRAAARSSDIAPRPVTSAPASPAATALSEADLMAQLRQLADSDPEQSLRLVADGNTRFADSPDAAERAWRSVKSLVNLKRFHEARAEAEIMVARYPGTSWSLDVQRHLLVYPLDQPSREEQQRSRRDGH